MLHHLAITVADLRVSREFYEGILVDLGYKVVLARKDLVALEGDDPEILLYAARPAQVANKHSTYDPGFHHAAFQVASRDIVQRVAKNVVIFGGTLLDGPKVFENYSPTYFAVYFLDPDGLKIEVMTKAPN